MNICDSINPFLHPTAEKQRNPYCSEFIRDYAGAYGASGCPDITTMQELFVAAVGGQPEIIADIRLHPLFAFFRSAYERNLVPLNWCFDSDILAEMYSHVPERRLQKGKCLMEYVEEARQCIAKRLNE